MVQATDFRNAMSLLTSAVSVVTTAGMSGRFGFTASAVCSVTDTRRHYWCMNQSASSHAHFLDNKNLNCECVRRAPRTYFKSIFI